jgi:hypothetical protein
MKGELVAQEEIDATQGKDLEASPATGFRFR